VHARNADDLVGDPPGRDLAAQRCQQCFVTDGFGAARLHDQDWPLAPAQVRPADDGRERHFRQRTNHRLDLGGIDPLAAGLDQVLGPARDDEIAGRIDAREIAGGKPAIGIGRALLLAEVSFDHRRAAHAQVALDPALFRQRPAVGIGEQQVDTHAGTSRQVRRACRGMHGRHGSGW